MKNRSTISKLVANINSNLYEGQRRLDANETAMLELQLEQLRAKTFDVIYAEQKARKFLPLITDVDPGAEFYAYAQTDEVGKAKIVTNYADDIPSSEISTEKFVHQIVPVASAFEYSVQDMYRAAFTGVPLEARKGQAARRRVETEIDDIAATGNAAHNIQGFINNSNVEISASTGAVWTTNPTVMLADLNKLVADAITAAQETVTFDTVLMPLAQYLLASQTLVDTQNPQTVLSAFKNANPQITLIDSWNVLDGAGESAKDRLVCYSRSPENVGLVIPLEFELRPPQAVNLAFKIIGHARTAGSVIYRPVSVRYMDLG